MGAALRHFVEQALGTRLDDFDDWFPPVFDWRGLCADVPEMVQRVSQDWIDADDLSVSEGLRRRAQEYFRHGHLTGVAVLAAAFTNSDDPDETLERLTGPLSGEEERTLGRLVREQVGPVEAALGGAEVTLDAEGTALGALFDRSWPTVQDLLALDVADDESPDGLSVDAVARPVLIAVARLGLLLACARCFAAGLATQ